MSEIYWLTRLSGFKAIAIILLVLSIIAVVVAAYWYANTSENYMEKEREALMTLIRKWKATWVCSLLFGILGVIFIPTQREILLIYGLGSTIDYVKSNDKAKQLPDKVVNALTRYVDSIEKENKDNSNN